MRSYCISSNDLNCSRIALTGEHMFPSVLCPAQILDMNMANRLTENHRSGCWGFPLALSNKFAGSQTAPVFRDPARRGISAMLRPDMSGKFTIAFIPFAFVYYLSPSLFGKNKV